MNKTVLVIAPHEDDELNLFGPFFSKCRSFGFATEVVFITNGDFSLEADVRYKESQAVAHFLKISRVVYFGYPDSGTENELFPTIYDNGETATLSVSEAKTYGPSQEHREEDYSFVKRGTHSFCSRQSLRDDLVNFLFESNPSVVITTAFDPHPDHRITSVVVDEAMRTLILSEVNFRPLYLKAFAYLGTWLGPYDYLDFPSQETKPFLDGKIASSLPFVWSDRIRLFAPSSSFSPFFWRSSLYRAYSKYVSQKGALHFFACSNTDKCFWEQKTSNIALCAKVSVSSGNPIPINDYKLLDSRTMRRVDLSRENSDLIHWSPSLSDQNPEVILKFSNVIRCKRIRIHNGYGKEQIDGYIVCGGLVVPFMQNEYIKEIEIDADTQEIIFCFSVACKDNIAIREIEVFEDEDITENELLSSINASASVPRPRSIGTLGRLIVKAVRRICLAMAERRRRKLLKRLSVAARRNSGLNAG